MRRLSARHAENEIIRHCHRGLDVSTVQRQVLRSLGRLMPVDAAFFATTDPETLLFTSAWCTEEPLTAATELFLDNEFGRRDVNKFAALATSTRHVASLDGATGCDRDSSLRYRDIMRPLGLGDELRAALVAGSSGDTQSPGVVLLAEGLSVVAITPQAEHLLSMIEPAASAGHPLPIVVRAVAVALRAVERGSAPATLLPSTRIQTAAGRWLKVHASHLHGSPGEDRIAIVVEPTEARAAVPLMLAAYGLSRREAEVARLVLRGTATRAIADTLHISAHTVQDHLKAVFDKVGVRSRRDLVGRLLSPPRSD
ncbi:MAG TPA: helix-turn-helix transcriptional regulator [Pseudonocardiaceae bacterium]|nr:helix-turn-helix transcriptional regulator [Pseudonocardiaceae bacterium]